MSQITHSNINKIFEKKLFILDLDGTVYLGGKPLPGIEKFLKYLVNQNKKILFITNNSSKSFRMYLKLLQSLFGSIVHENNIFSSVHSTIESLNSRKISKAYILAVPEVLTDFKNNGIAFSEMDPQAVVIAFDTSLTYEKLRKATSFINKGIEYFMTHADLVCPTAEGYIPDAGSILALIEAATKKKPTEICGKPNKRLIENILKHEGVGQSDAVLFGDRLYTDIRMANENGVLAVLVLTGETSLEDVGHSQDKPDYILKDFQLMNSLVKIE